MAKKEAVQEELNLMRSIFLTSLAAVFGVYGYFAVNFEKLKQATIILGLIGVFILSMIIIVCAKKWKESKDILEQEN